MAKENDHESRSCADLVQSLTPYSDEIYLWEGAGKPPERIMYGDVLLERFMDRIYVPVPIEALAPAQISLVNALRRTLVLRDDVDRANELVKRYFAAVIEAAGARDILEWGCGYDSMARFIPLPESLTFVDVDPHVVRWQAARGCRCFHTSEPMSPAGYDAIVSVFVFHFHVSCAHVASMAGALRPSGFVLANVYRRGDTSRADLRGMFERHGLTVASLDDPLGLCARHQFWAMSHTRPRDELVMLLRAGFAGL